jgi:hypothetical protein
MNTKYLVGPLSLVSVVSLVLASALGAPGCSDSDPGADGGPSSTTPSATAPSMTAEPTTTVPPAPMADASLPVDGSDGGATCTAALATLLKPIDSVSSGVVTVLSSSGTAKTLYVDAMAGGSAASNTNPRIYLDLEKGARVDKTDKTAPLSTDWDLALKRPILFSNGGQAGAGQGGSVFLPGKTFADVVPGDATGKTFATERFVDDECNPQLDATGAVKTSFDGWYDYDSATNRLSPKVGTYLVKGAKGSIFKVQIVSYYASPDGGIGMSGGAYVLQVGPL